jgi:hypothetical protein
MIFLIKVLLDQPVTCDEQRQIVINQKWGAKMELDKRNYAAAVLCLVNERILFWSLNLVRTLYS